MPYDPRMLQMAQAGVRMMGPDQRNAFADPRSQQQPKQWWDQPMPGPPAQMGQPADQSKPDDPNASKKPPQPSLLQMLMLGGQPTYSGTPRPGTAGANPWGWLGSMGMPGGGGGGKP